ncbi:hypothetical protein [Pseudomonas nunensis]|uniref:Uncharacterized protein n=1 Tax=Pseudomonas nunensis TaxID=2961896 RepID=A0ABY5EN82_9PSED|nr:hypothetical protein [Pseudomonas nunensis]KPN90913.1 hypothetical protein AL066_11435 [Pseudomonas nunensis]MCL5228270.1 hypothetical protein [Pseudomonas nunensis]UTO17179.1 hypothetical protein NK667_12765 [Pseudomonas nunensis]
MSHLKLALFLNELARTNQVLISEGESSLSASNLHESATLRVIDIASEVGWNFSIYDTHGNEYQLDEVSDDFGPFRIDLEKPEPQVEEDRVILFLVTEIGFRSYLKKGHSATQWRVPGLTKPFCSFPLQIQKKRHSLSGAFFCVFFSSGIERKGPGPSGTKVISNGQYVPHDRHRSWFRIGILIKDSESMLPAR